MDERLKQYLSLKPAEQAEFLRSLSPTEQGALLKTVLAQISPTGGGPADPSTTLPATRADRGGTTLPATRSDRGGTTLPAPLDPIADTLRNPQDALAAALNRVTTPTEEQRIAAVERRVEERFAREPTEVIPIRGDSAAQDMKRLQRSHERAYDRIRAEEYKKAGLPYERTTSQGGYSAFEINSLGLNRMGANYEGTGDPLRDNRLDDMAARNVPAQQEAARRQGLRDDARLPVYDNLMRGMGGSDSPMGARSVFTDNEGNIEGPKQLKERLIREGVSQNDASIAAGQRYNDMFSPKPGTFGYTGPSAQTLAVQQAFEEGRQAYISGEKRVGPSAGEVAAKMKEARADNLRALAAERMNDPNRKPVGLVTAITSGSTGEIIAKRGEGDARVINAGTYAGNVESVPGKMELTPAGERMIRDRVTTAQFNREAEMGGASGMTAQIPSTAATGRYGTAVGRQTSLVDELKASGKLPSDFQLTKEQRLGEAPLPSALTEARETALAEAKTVAEERGTVSDPGTRVAMGIAGKDGVARIDNQADTAANMAKVSAENKLGNDFLNAFTQAGGKTSGAKFDPAKPPGPRTEGEMGAMRDFLGKSPDDRNKIVAGLTGTSESPGERERRRRMATQGRRF